MNRNVPIRVFDFDDRGRLYVVKTVRAEWLVECPNCFAVFTKPRVTCDVCDRDTGPFAHRKPINRRNVGTRKTS